MLAAGSVGKRKQGLAGRSAHRATPLGEPRAQSRPWTANGAEASTRSPPNPLVPPAWGAGAIRGAISYLGRCPPHTRKSTSEEEHQQAIGQQKRGKTLGKKRNITMRQQTSSSNRSRRPRDNTKHANSRKPNIDRCTARNRDGTRTHNLLLRREAPYPLGHTSVRRDIAPKNSCLD